MLNYYKQKIVREVLICTYYHIFLEKEVKNLLKMRLSEIISNITDDFIKNLFIVNPENKIIKEGNF